MAQQEDGNRHDAVAEWTSSGDFLGAILAGVVLGFLGDWAFGTDPLLVVLGAVAGFGVGFWRLYEIAKKTEEEELRRRARRPHP